MDAPYHVVYPGNVLEAFAQVCDNAIDLGAMSAVESAAEAIHLQLQIDPRGFGDPCYTLPATKQKVYLRGYPPLFVYYAVHEPSKSVFVQRIRWMPPGS